MQIQHLNIERFGHKTNLILDGIADRLNVVYGPNGSGKSTTIHFIRWMLYGNNDESTRRYLSGYQTNADGYGTATTPAAGSMAFISEGNRRSLARQDDGSRYGRVALDGDHRYARQSSHLVSLLGSISQHDFDVLYAPDFENEHGLTALLQSGMTSGIDLTSQRLPSERVQELRLRIDNYRRDIDQLPWSSGDLDSLLDRKRGIERRIDTMTDEQRRRRLEYDREYEELNRRIQDLELEVDRQRTAWHTRDEEVTARRRELEEAYRSAEEAKREYLTRRRTELADLENHLSRARSMQTELQRRYDMLESQLRAEEINLDRTPKDLEESACLVQSIARQLDDMQGVVLPEVHDQGTHRSAFRNRDSRAASSTSIDMLRHEVSQLCDTLQQERSGDRVKAIADELEQLRHTDTTMQRWISGLATQRDQLAQEIEEAERHGVSLVVEAPHQSSQEPQRDLEILDPLRTGRLKAVRHSCDGYEPIHPEEDTLLVQLTRQRDAAQSELQSAERQLTQLMERRRDLESALQRLTEREIESARRELAEVDSLLRSAEERDRLQREIHQTESELSRLRDVVRNSPVTDHASRILRRLTHGRYTNLRIDNTRNVSVEDADSTMVPMEHLSRGLRDQVYLSFCLAMITAHRQRGVRLPFILNDAFTNVDSEQDDVLADVLREFSEMDQQVLVFTRHQHVAQLLRSVNARYLELGGFRAPSVQPAPPPTESIDRVRFRPRAESPVEYRNPPVQSEFAQPPPQPQSPVDPPPFREATPRQPQRSEGTFDRWEDTGSGDDLFEDYRETDERPFENIAQPIHRPLATSGLENVTFSNHPPTQRSARPQPKPPIAPRYSSTLTTSVDATETVDQDVASRLRALGIVSVRDFLKISAAKVEEHIRGWGIESRPIRRWQDQLTLRCFVSGIGADDARLLVACGIGGVEALAQIDIDTLNERLQHLLSTQRTRSGARYSSMRSSYDPRRLQQWIRSAREAVSRRRSRSSQAELLPPYDYDYDPDFDDPDTSRRSASREQGLSRNDDRRAHEVDDRDDVDRDFDAGEQARHESSNRSRSGNGSGRGTANGNRDSARRGSRSGRSSHAQSRQNTSTTSRARESRSSRSERSSRAARSRGTDEQRELKFYLDRNDPVVDAPTIGPKTAERLKKAGIHTVHDLLVADPQSLADKIDHDRISVEDIREWQHQSILACRIPKMRGHDAQVLVACGIKDADELAGMSPEALWDVVEPFLGTTECKRIIRNGKAPDFEEIQDWIMWAQSARSLQAA